MTRLILVQQNDAHAHIEPHWELGWHDGLPTVWRAGGYGHLSALADAIRADTGGACVHVDFGEAIHGTGAAQWTAGAAIVPALNAVGVDVMTLGNWEFGFGSAALREQVAELSFPVIATNVRRADTGASEFAATDLREVGGLRAAYA